METFLGVDIGGTNVKFGLVDTEGNLSEKKKYKVKKIREQHADFLEGLLTCFAEQLELYPQIKKVGIGQINGMNVSPNIKCTLSWGRLPCGKF